MNKNAHTLKLPSDFHCCDVNLEHHSILVTGADQQPGLSIAAELAGRKAQIIAAGEPPQDRHHPAHAFNWINPTVIDTPNQDQVRQLEHYLSSDRSLGLVLSHQMFPPLSPLEHVQEDDWQKAMRINLIEHRKLLTSFAPLMRTRADSYIIRLSCEAINHPRAYFSTLSVPGVALDALIQIVIDETGDNTRGYSLDIGSYDPSYQQRYYPGKSTAIMPKNDRSLSDYIIFLAQNQEPLEYRLKCLSQSLTT